MIKLKGAPVSEKIQNEIKNEISKWDSQGFQRPHLTVILVGHNLASQIYVKRKQDMCKKLGYTSEVISLDENVDQKTVLEKIDQLNTNVQVDGILVQLPLPQHLNARLILDRIIASKDVDCLTEKNLGRLLTGTSVIKPCTPSGVIELLHFYNIPLVGKKVAVIGRSLIVGTPLMHMLMKENATVTLFHSFSNNLKTEIKNFDIVCVAVGQKALLKHSDFSKDCVVIDIGMNRSDDGVTGDVIDDINDEDYLKALTPVPGGVGLMTIAMLMKNTLTLALKQRSIDPQ